MSSDWDQTVKRDRAWIEAREQWASVGTVPAVLTDERVQRCIAGLGIDSMTDTCWSNLLIAFPQE